MFPEESFAEVEWERIEEGWRKGQGYLSGKDGEQRSWVGGGVTERPKRDEAGELGRKRVGWSFGSHG